MRNGRRIVRVAYEHVPPLSDWPKLILSHDFTSINTLAVSSQPCLSTPLVKMEQWVPKRRHVKFRRRGIAQKKEYNIYDIFIYCSWVSTRWYWSVYKRETAIYTKGETTHKTIQEHRIQNTQNRKQK